MGGKHDCRRPLTDCTVRSHIVVVLAPKLNLCSGVVKALEPMLVQAFKANASVEAIDESIVCRFAGSAEVQDDTVRIGPQVKQAGHISNIEQAREFNGAVGGFLDEVESAEASAQ
jgi:hypothetical protein